jgi:hypothetical protein
MRSYCRLAVALTFALACGNRNDRRHVAADSLAPAPAATQTAAPSASKGKCPANGQWSECAVFDRLDHAGLAPRRDSSGTIDLAPLTQKGSRLLVGNSELDVFIYPDTASRVRDEARLDRSKYIEATAEPTLRGEATLIRNMNLLAVLRSRNDHQRERVSDALSAGPPQAPRATTLPDTRAR